MTKTIWKEQMGDVEPIGAFPPGELPSIRNTLKRFRYLCEIDALGLREAAIQLAEELEEHHPGSVQGTTNFAVKHITNFWNRTK